MKRISIKTTVLFATFFAASAIITFAWPVPEGRMTGGGSFFQGSMRITHGFELHCNPSIGSNNLEINWGGGNKFHLDTLQKATCWNTGISPAPPAAPFDEYFGNGTGTYNGVAGAFADWQFTDHGEPGKKDSVTYLTITDAGGNVVLNLSAASGPYYLDSGNQQAHAEN